MHHTLAATQTVYSRQQLPVFRKTMGGPLVEQHEVRVRKRWMEVGIGTKVYCSVPI